MFRQEAVAILLMSELIWVSRLANSLFFVLILRLFDSQHCVKLIGSDVVEGKGDADLEGSTKIKRPAQELPGFGVLRGVQPV